VSKLRWQVGEDGGPIVRKSTDATVLAREIVIRFLSFDPDIKDNGQDKVRRYALQVLNLGLLWHGFNDAIKEGDGNRIFNYYKFFLLVYKAGKCHNYCKEIINLFLQYHFLFTERQAQQLKWCRVVNTQGKPGKNVSCDLHIEHLNNRLKGMINNIHAKNPDNAIDRVAKSIGTVHQVCEIFERENHAVHVQYRPVITSHTRGIFCVVPRNTTALATELSSVAHGGFAAWHTRVVCHACDFTSCHPWHFTRRHAWLLRTTTRGASLLSCHG